MDTKTTGQAADALGVDVGTIRNWTDEAVFKPYYSNVALRVGDDAKAHRQYTLDDMLVLNTIRYRKNIEGETWEQIADYLATGERHDQFPVNADIITPETQAEVLHALSVARVELQALKAQNEELKAQLAEERQARLEDKERLNRELTQREIEFVKQIAVLEYRLSQHE